MTQLYISTAVLAWFGLLYFGMIWHAKRCHARDRAAWQAYTDRNLAVAKVLRPKRREAGKKAYATERHNQYLRDPLVKEMRG